MSDKADLVLEGGGTKGLLLFPGLRPKPVAPSGSKHRPVNKPDRVLSPARSRPGHPMGRNRGVCARCWYPKGTSRRPHRQHFVDRAPASL